MSWMISSGTPLAQDRCAVLWVLLQRWVDLPIEIVEQTDQSPLLHLGRKSTCTFGKLFGIETHGGFHREHVADKSFIFDIFTNKS